MEKMEEKRKENKAPSQEEPIVPVYQASVKCLLWSGSRHCPGCAMMSETHPGGGHRLPGGLTYK